MEIKNSSYILNVKDNFCDLLFDGNELHLPVSNIIVEVDWQKPKTDFAFSNIQAVMTSRATRRTTVTLEFFQDITVTTNSNGRFRIEEN